MIHKFTLTILLSLFLTVVSSAQVLKEFSSNPQEFMSQLDVYMNKNKREDIEIIFKTFKKQYESGVFNAEQATAIHLICDGMLKQKMAPSPYFMGYLNTLNNINQLGKSATKIDEFNNLCTSIIADIQKRNAKNYKQFLGFAENFYVDNSIRKSTGSMWRTEAASYKMEYKEKELYVKFDQVDLYGIRKQDSIKIEQTTGAYYPFTDTWKGEKGQVSWERNEMEDVFVKLGKYEFEVKKNVYTCDDATLYFPKYFKNVPIKGVFEDRIVVKSAGSKSTYPRFESSNKLLKIDNIGSDVEYQGGFKLQGSTIYGYGDKDRKARIQVKSPSTGKTIFKATSLQFTIKEDVGRLLASSTETVLYFGKDSIYHPSSNVRFDIEEKNLSLERGERGNDRNPFYDSYHNIRLDAENLNWKLDTDSIVIGKTIPGIGGGNDKTASFESIHYFNEGGYRELQNISTVNPIAAVMAYSREIGSDELDGDGLARKINAKFSLKSIKSLLYSMVSRGFVEFDDETGTVYIQEKLKHYAKAAVNKTDYDNVLIVSKSKKTNGVIYLNDKSENPIDIKAVKYVELSKVQKVAFKPRNNQLLLKKNRNLEYNGKTFAGMSAFQGVKNRFDYDAYQIKMDSVRYFDLFENSGGLDENDLPIAYSIGSRIENLSGALIIDAPNNKSSNEDIAMFPSFSSKGPSYVYYNSAETRGYAYKRDSFYFELDEFGFHSLDNYQPSDIKFKGTMFSSDIFAPFEETVSLVEEDKSLGFIHDTPSGGYPAYVRESKSGKGDFKGELSLSNAGFLAKGDINYLAASISSEDIAFEPKEMTCSARRFDLEENRGAHPKLPQVSGIDVNVSWLPYKDSMYVTPEEAPFSMFKSGLHTMEGVLILTPGGLRGRGLVDWDKASMTSKDFLFGAYSLTADTSNIAIKAKGTADELAFDSRNVMADVDFDKGIGVFKNNSDGISTSMPYNKYKTSMSEFTWKMKEETVEFKALDGKVDEFLAPELDSLRFEGATAMYDIKTSTLKIGGVPFIKTADALVYPETGDVEVTAGGKMGTLENARILASDKTKYHAINRATVNIQGGRDYTASGFYEYNIGDRKQEIEFTNIIGAPIGKGKRTEKALATRGSGKVSGDADFYMDVKTKFKGEISLSSEKRDLYFDGYAQLDMDLPQKSWFTVQSDADKRNLAIRYAKPKTPNGDPLKTGIFIDKMMGNPYPSIMGILFARKDRAIMDVTGVFKYDKTNDAFIFGDSIKLTSKDYYKGNTFTVSNKTKECVAVGTFNIGENVKFFKPTVVGKAVVKMKNEVVDSLGVRQSSAQKLVLDAMAGISYKLPEEAMKVMVKDFQVNTYDVASHKLSAKYEKLLPDIIGGMVKNKEGYNQVVKNYPATGKVTLPNTEKHLFFFSYLPMKWDPELKSLVSKTKNIGLAQMNGVSINKTVEAYVEFRMPSNGEDGMHLYIKNPSSGGHYYYFKYKNGELETVSSNPTYNSAISGAKKKELEIKMGKEGVYKISPISPVSADMFISRVKGAW